MPAAALSPILLVATATVATVSNMATCPVSSPGYNCRRCCSIECSTPNHAQHGPLFLKNIKNNFLHPVSNTTTGQVQDCARHWIDCRWQISCKVSYKLPWCIHSELLYEAVIYDKNLTNATDQLNFPAVEVHADFAGGMLRSVRQLHGYRWTMHHLYIPFGVSGLHRRGRC